MIGHLSLPVANFERARDFYDSVLATLGVRRVMDMEFEDYVAAGYGGSEHEPVFWIGAAPDRASVNAIHAPA